jgi:hypothetical protein
MHRLGSESAELIVVAQIETFKRNRRGGTVRAACVGDLLGGSWHGDLGLIEEGWHACCYSVQVFVCERMGRMQNITHHSTVYCFSAYIEIR